MTRDTVALASNLKNALSAAGVNAPSIDPADIVLSSPIVEVRSAPPTAASKKQRKGEKRKRNRKRKARAAKTRGRKRRKSRRAPSPTPSTVTTQSARKSKRR